MAKYYQVITAKYMSVCEVCGKIHEPGSEIAWKRLGRKSYVRCPECQDVGFSSKKRNRGIGEDAWIDRDIDRIAIWGR